RERIAARHPDHQVLGEELGGPAAGGGSRGRWICDPRDGTTNFAHGVPLFCSSVALELDGQLEVGAIYDPLREVLVTARRGAGAFLKDMALPLSTMASLTESLLDTGFPYSVQAYPAEGLELFGAFLPRSRAVRRLGSAALEMSSVAAGRLQAL